MRRALFGALAVASLLLAASPARAQRAVFVVRHAEKASDSNEPAVPLSPAGEARAKRLAAILAKTGVTAIYSTDTVRTLDTAKPLAQALKITISKYVAKGADGKPDPAPLVRILKTRHGRDVVLVVGHSDTVPPLLKALGCGGEIVIPSNQYDDIFVVVPSDAGRATLLRLAS